jgi:transposase
LTIWQLRKLDHTVADKDPEHLKLFLPPYSPELNPDELVHRTVKARVPEEAFPETIYAQLAQILGISRG